MRHAEGLASVIEEEMFVKRLKKLSELPQSAKRQRLSSINCGERVRFQDHMNTNIEIEGRKIFEAEWRHENPDGEYQD